MPLLNLCIISRSLFVGSLGFFKMKTNKSSVNKYSLISSFLVYMLFIFLAMLFWLAFLLLFWIGLQREEGHPHIVTNLIEKPLSFTITYDISCRFYVDVLLSFTIHWGIFFIMSGSWILSHAFFLLYWNRHGVFLL